MDEFLPTHWSHGNPIDILGAAVEFGEREKLTRITADILLENVGMRQAAEKVGFRLSGSSDDLEIRAEIDLPRK
jgi:RimJ/RimL family protein N-acetyltransferase